MADAFGRARHKFNKRTREARKNFKEVKDKSLGLGLVRLIRGLRQIDTKLDVINHKLTLLLRRKKQH
ncbi:hypothetical protein SAMN04487897_103256 [Paenibacillus sp. yr247]|nr:hypothetical protein SAMN04487897_103256 [Paenibacillus sp. yr247]